ncbi:MAG TPA: hypothetical protein VJ869_11915 [Sphaerochaeta sp.]|nr:hypothetical protein [Sphaerochaeta sp.]
MSSFVSAPRMADCIAYQRYADEVLAPQMERATLKRIKELEAEGKYDTEEYDSLLVPYYERHVLRQPMAPISTVPMPCIWLCGMTLKGITRDWLIS